jgi:hypothetical protein
VFRRCKLFGDLPKAFPIPACQWGFGTARQTPPASVRGRGGGS